MTINQLIYFVTVVKYNNITKAAKELYVSQPAISSAIKDLEDEFESCLFERKNNQLTLTNEGKYLYLLANNLIDEYNNVRQKMTNFIRKKELVKIGVNYTIGTYMFPDLYRIISSENPDLQFLLSHVTSSDYIDDINNKEIDVAITIVERNTYNPNFEYRRLGETELLCAVRKDNPIAKLENVTASMLKDTPIILPKEGSLQSDLIFAEFAKEGATPNIKVRTNHVATTLALLKSDNSLCSFIFDKMIQGEDDLVGIPTTSHHLKYDVVAVWNPKFVVSDTVNKIIDAVTKMGLF